jgi:CRISPR-associated endonuclease/helicase Cas3
MVLAGYVTVADWIGSVSAADYFEWHASGPSDYPAYFERVRGVAKRALVKLRWVDDPRPAGPGDFETVIGLAPRRLQEATASPEVTAASLVVVEAPMGEGKTEAALHLVDTWNAGDARGFYIGLPTQATANQMHGRVRQYLARRLDGRDVNLVLAHGGAMLQDLDVLPAAVFSEDDDAAAAKGYRLRDGEGAVAAGEWFLQRKRALLAACGVGTIDQALMAVLQVKHVFVRLFGLAGKPVVIDEVHAYDTYMTGLLERLLEWLGALESPVVLLSATLPSERRRRLLRAYLRGRSGDMNAEPERAGGAAYPRVSYLDGSREAAIHFEADDRSRRTLRLEHAPEDPAALARYLDACMGERCCAVVVCNTVARAQETYRALREELGLVHGEQILLFHARFREKDRQEIERRVLQLFGPPDANGDRTASRPPGRFVLVATQVVEQSLDVDFDLMVSDMAPADLLLQRAGRLRRHRRSDRGAGDDTLHVRWPPEKDGVPQFDGGTKAVYDEHILLRTWAALQAYRMQIAIPDDVSKLVDRVYAEGEVPPPGDLPAEAQLVWQETAKKMFGEREKAEEEARARRLRTPCGELAEPWEFLKEAREEDEPELHPKLQALTRLAEPSINVVLLPAGVSPPGEKTRLPPGRVKELLAYGLLVTHASAVRALAAETPPPAFAATSALRRHRLLQLDGDGAARHGALTFRYSAELGLIIEGSPAP